MSSIIKFDLKELRELALDKNSCIVEKKVTRSQAIKPWCLGNLKESIKRRLDYKIGKFDKEFDGILLSYKNLKILQNVGTIKNDNSDIHFQVQADYFIFRPYCGATLTGIVNKKSYTHLGILVHRVFNVVIPRPTEEPGNKWVGAGIKEGQEVFFKIIILDLFGALPYIRGELDERSFNMGADCDDDDLELKQVNLLNVSYIDFDKIKPNIQKQSGDGGVSLTNSPQKTNAKLQNSNKLSIKNKETTNKTDENSESVNEKIKTTPGKTDSETSSYEKMRKRQSKMDAEQKHTEGNGKTIKKNKKEN